MRLQREVRCDQIGDVKPGGRKRVVAIKQEGGILDCTCVYPREKTGKQGG